MFSLCDRQLWSFTTKMPLSRRHLLISPHPGQGALSMQTRSQIRLVFALNSSLFTTTLLAMERAVFMAWKVVDWPTLGRESAFQCPPAVKKALGWRVGVVLLRHRSDIPNGSDLVVLEAAGSQDRRVAVSRTPSSSQSRVQSSTPDIQSAEAAYIDAMVRLCRMVGTIKELCRECVSDVR
jgi:hypothetical protein